MVNCDVLHFSWFSRPAAYLNLSISTLEHVAHARLRLDSILMIMRTGRGNCSIQLLKTPQIHRRSQKRDDVRVESLPVRVVEVVLLGLWRKSVCYGVNKQSFL